ncbi:G protein-activated inward rectifier potassium channel 3-like isoform X1 [Schistocerca gregaria]|uniref:G protein-activated inward rectifier potassium channel 3-like isoform X1 n=1 Tax=Schistocerca gregaria TaxID=7010 RepID=UPI00211E06B6|nr:G protein-activated inward rectifier potassium channel 3-like isoform X1 [Schistocerca gregaria]XP_049854872.1 G protein-activated inward rectifier potassium channel 3-like isoform X1 [Schistocerca gregaria]
MSAAEFFDKAEVVAIPMPATDGEAEGAPRLSNMVTSTTTTATTTTTTTDDDENNNTEAAADDGYSPLRSPIDSMASYGDDSRTLLNPAVWSRATPASHLSSARSGASRRSRYRKVRRRVVLKSGECNVVQTHVAQRRLRYMQDIFTTLVDTQWRWTLLVFALGFILSWLAFAVIWWLIAFTHGDLEPEHQEDDSGWRPCVVNLNSFASCFLFSIETQHTIGYGSRSTTEECPEAIFVMCLQSICGVMIQAFMVGIVFAKMSRPKQRTQTLLFSRNAVICLRDGLLALMFRVGDMRKSHIIGATVRAQLIRTRRTKEGEELAQSQWELDVGTDDGDNNLFFIWPMTVIHRITESSPLYSLSAADLLDTKSESRFEIVVILEGTIESTGQTTQARSSYLPTEILWGHRFEPMVAYNKERQAYEVNYSLFNNTHTVDTPLCSAKDLADFYRLQEFARSPASRLSDLGSSLYSSQQHLLPDEQRNSKTAVMCSQNTPLLDVSDSIDINNLSIVNTLDETVV